MTLRGKNSSFAARIRLLSFSAIGLIVSLPIAGLCQVVPVAPLGGGSDDTVNINNKIAMALAQPNPGEVLFSPGTYIVSGAINCDVLNSSPNGVWIHGPAVIANNSSFAASLIKVTGNGLFVAGDTAVVNLGQYCRWTGISVNTQLAVNPKNSNTALDTVNVIGTHVGIDGHASLMNGRYNIYCSPPPPGVDGLQVKDVQVIGAASGNINIPGMCGNVRLLGDLISGSNGFGVLFGGDDLTVEGGVI